MFVRKGIFGALSMLVLLATTQLPARAQSVAQDLVEDTQAVEEVQTVESAQAESVAIQPAAELTPAAETGAAALTYDGAEEPLELAQSRRRTGSTANSSFIGIGADIGYADDISFAVISKIAFTNRLAVRPSVLIGNDVAVLVPVTYDFRQYAPEAGGFQFIPYGGVGAAYNSSDDSDSDINLLLSAGVDVPVSRRFTVNAQANLGVFNDTDFGVTVGAGYNIGNLF
ncbi:MAG: hypothetical protein WA949_06525 [Phormidesmis sp.]